VAFTGAGGVALAALSRDLIDASRARSAADAAALASVEGGPAAARRVELLRAQPLFAPLSLATIEHLAGSLRPVTFDPDAWLMREGDPGDRYVLIDRGEADDKIIAVLEGDYVWGEARGLSDVPAENAPLCRSLVMVAGGDRKSICAGSYLSLGVSGARSAHPASRRNATGRPSKMRRLTIGRLPPPPVDRCARIAAGARIYPGQGASPSSFRSCGAVRSFV